MVYARERQKKKEKSWIKERKCRRGWTTKNMGDGLVKTPK